MSRNGLGAARLIDADRPDRAAALLQHIAADPPNVVGHLLVADLPGAFGGRLQLLRRLPTASTKDHERVHAGPPLRNRVRRTLPPPGRPFQREPLAHASGPDA